MCSWLKVFVFFSKTLQYCCFEGLHWRTSAGFEGNAFLVTFDAWALSGGVSNLFQHFSLTLKIEMGEKKKMKLCREREREKSGKLIFFEIYVACLFVLNWRRKLWKLYVVGNNTLFLRPWKTHFEMSDRRNNFHEGWLDRNKKNIKHCHFSYFSLCSQSSEKYFEIFVFFARLKF